jgi:hypothetical protein
MPDQPQTDVPLRYEWILLAETWQVFGVIMGTMFFGVLVTAWVELEGLPEAFSVGSNYISEILLAGWFYAVGRNLYNIRPPHARISIVFFVFNLVYFLLYSVVLLFLSVAFLDAPIWDLTARYAWLVLPFHLYAIVAACSIVAFTAKALVSVETGQPVTSSMAGGTFLLLFFFPFGIWLVQPRIQHLFRDRIVHEDDLAGDLIDL